MFCLAATPCVQAHRLLQQDHNLYVPPGVRMETTSFSATLLTVWTANKSNTDSARLYVFT